MRGALAATLLSSSPKPRFLFDASRLDAMLQTAGGAAVAADGDPVGWIAELTGSFSPLEQATSGKRPLYKATAFNGFPCWEFDGLDDLMVSADVALPQPCTYYIAVKRLTAAARCIFDGGVSTTRNRYALASSGTAHFLSVGNGITSASSLVGSAPYVASIVFNGQGSLLEKDGVLELSGNASAQSLGGLTIASQFDAGSPANIQIAYLAGYAGQHETGLRNRLVRQLQRAFALS